MNTYPVRALITFGIILAAACAEAPLAPYSTGGDADGGDSSPSLGPGEDR